MCGTKRAGETQHSGLPVLLGVWITLSGYTSNCLAMFTMNVTVVNIPMLETTKELC